MCNDHPLVEYIEDPIAEGDVIGYLKILKRFRSALPKVNIGVKQWFKSSLDNIKTVKDTSINYNNIYSILNSSCQKIKTKKKKRKKKCRLLQ